MKMKTINKILLLGLLSAGLSACNGFFDKDNTPAPASLVTFSPEVKPLNIWYMNAGAGSGKDYLKLVPAASTNAIFVADKNGRVIAVDKVHGKKLWDVSTNYSVTGGPGAGDGIVVMGSRFGDVVALSQADGRKLWTGKISSEILASPTIANHVVLVKSIDGKVNAYSSADGHVLWTYQQAEPNLILRGSSAPQITNNVAVVGFANGNLAKLSLQNGDVDWQQTIATPEGIFAIQRLVDIDANPYIYGNRVYAATYQGRIMALALSSGENVWTHDISSYTGIAADNSQIYITDAKSHVWAFDPNNGNVNWRQPQLEARNITGPAVMGNYLVVGDAEGYLHWMSKQDGHFVARVKMSSSGIIATPVVDNGVLYVLTKDGHLGTYQLG
jgi:outer membrane protein assembly factor BamB